MPVQECMIDGKPAYRWGDSGKAYTYTPGNESSRKEAKRKAYIQGVAVESSIEKIVKSEDENLDLEFMAKSFDDENNMIFGWGYVAKDEMDKQEVDHSDELVDDLDDLANGVYAFNLAFRESGFMHIGKAKGYLVESMVFTKEKMAKLNIPEGTLPQGAWVGFFFPDDADYAIIKSMKSPMFSIQGNAIKEEV